MDGGGKRGKTRIGVGTPLPASPIGVDQREELDFRPHISSMLRAARLASQSSRRSFATVVDAAGGVKVAALDNGQPISTVTVLLKAGSRYEQKPGLAHVLSNFAFKVRPIRLYTSNCILISAMNYRALGSARHWAPFVRPNCAAVSSPPPSPANTWL